MQRIRLLRILVPIVVLGLVAAIALTFRARPQRRGVTVETAAGSGSRMEGFRFSDLVGSRRQLLLQARVGRVDDQGAFDVEQVERMEVDREGRTPLLLTAARGAGSGAQGKRIVRLEGGVTMRDDDAGFDLEIPTVEVDQVAGVVRSLGPVRMKSQSWTGTASAVIYSLSGEPSQIMTLELTGPDGGHLAAHRATVPENSRILTLSEEVEASQGGMTIRATDVEVVRRPDGRIESAIATATPSVVGTAASLGGVPTSFAAHEVRASWDQAGKVVAADLTGNVEVRHARGTITADRMAAKAVDPAGRIVLDAAGQVVAAGLTVKGPGRVSCDALRATIDGSGAVSEGFAAGNVRFDGEGTAGEAAEATFTALERDGTVMLRASETRRARLASGRTRIVADSIVSDLRGSKVHAEGRVESTLLPAPRGQNATVAPMFQSTEAVHFVSASLDSENSGARLLFRGDVRGWQGDRTLAADEVETHQEGEILNAQGHVATRMPREATQASIEADYVQIGAERLAYRGAARTAEYEGDVRVRQAEGWLQTPKLHATLAEGGPGLREVQALLGVKFEYRAPGDGGVPTTVAGDGDRAVFDTAARVIHVYGDKAPATVRSTGAKGGTTVGRVLRYNLDTGALEVESGERDRATIRTPKI